MQNTITDSQMAKLIGTDNLIKLVSAYPGYRFNVPKRFGVLNFDDRDERNRRIREASYAGATNDEIAHEYGLSIEYTKKIVNKRK